MQPQQGWGVWPDVAVDDRVTYMESLIANNHPFKKHLWPGGFRGCTKLIYKPSKEQPAPRRHVLKPTKTINKPPSSRKQRRISNYFPKTASNPITNDPIVRLLTKVSSQVSKLWKDFKAMIKRRKTRNHSRRTAFHTLISADRQANLQSRGCQTDKEDHTTEAQAPTTVLSFFFNKTKSVVPLLMSYLTIIVHAPECPTPMEEDPTNCSSSVISQYEAQQYGRPGHKSPVHSSPAHTDLQPMDIEHTLPDHNRTEHTEHSLLPVHNSPKPKESVPPEEGTTPVRSLPLAASPSQTPPWLYTPESPPVIYKRSGPTIYTAADHPNSPPFHHLLNEGLEIFEPISPEAASLENPLYDTSTRRDDQPPPHPITPDTSPTKSSGFEEYAATVNAFAATATSRRISIPVLNFDQSQHMEILMYMLAGREKLAFTTPFLTSSIQEVWKRFKLIRRKDIFKWDNNLTDLVLKPGKKWMEDMVTIYTPMIWGDRHWVGLAINLDMGYVEIMDPQPSLYADKKVVKFMEGLLTSLPYLVKKVAKPQQTQFRGLKPFYSKRMKDINERGSDCGPLSIKFMELHAHGDPDPQMSGITDTDVDDLRKQYAMDVYKTIVLPAYHAPPML
ncbi:ULP_PROTEASE domain-containing protein [Raphanus sativus]|nr:ULP_PROTEASE domain-containing protein [Raphanus sativus]